MVGHRKNEMKKRAANNEKNNNEKQNERNSKNKKTRNLDVSEFTIENYIKSITELFAITDEQKKAERKHLRNFIWVNESTEWLTWKYPEDGNCKQKSFAFKTNLYVSDLWVVQTSVMENGWEVV